jgi:hypothetical protein
MAIILLQMFFDQTQSNSAGATDTALVGASAAGRSAAAFNFLHTTARHAAALRNRIRRLPVRLDEMMPTRQIRHATAAR